MASKINVRQTLKSADRFGDDISIGIAGSDKYRTIWGGITCAIIAAILLVIFSFYLIQMFNRTNRMFSTQTNYGPDIAPLYKTQQHRLHYAFGIYDREEGDIREIGDGDRFINIRVFENRFTNCTQE
jgi:hypothetical protein